MAILTNGTRLRTLALSSFLALGACSSGPERTPHQPVGGVDTETNEVDNPHDAPARSGTTGRATDGGSGMQPLAAMSGDGTTDRVANPNDEGGPVERAASTGRGFLDGFLTAIETEHQKQPGVIAVFPLLAKKGQTGALYVDALGERLANETVSGLELRGVEPVLGGANLRDEILASNRSIAMIGGVSDVLALADRIQATYAVYGTVRQRTLSRMKRDVVLDVQYVCRHLQTRRTVASFRPDLGRSDPLTADFTRYVGRSSSDWTDIGNREAGGEPSLQGEVRWIGRALARKLASRHAPLMSGKSVQIPPTVLATTAPQVMKLRDWATSFSEKLAEAEKAQGEGGDTEAAALATGPVTIAGKTYDTFRAALADYRSARESMAGSATGQLATDLAAGFREALASEVNLKVLNADEDKESLVNVIRREMQQSRQDGSVDADTVAFLEAAGTEVLIQTTLRRDLDSYVLRATVHDLTNNRKVSESLPFDARFNDDLEGRIGR